MAENIFLVNVQDPLAWSIMMWILKAITCCRWQNRDGVLLQVALLRHQTHQPRLSLFKRGEQTLRGVNAVLPPNSIEVCAGLSQALCTGMVHTCHNLCWGKCPLFHKTSGFIHKTSGFILLCPFTFCDNNWLSAGGSEVWCFKFSTGWMFSWMLLLFLQMNFTEKCSVFRQHLQLAYLPCVEGQAPEAF